MRKIIQFRWLIFIIWIAVALGLFLLGPDLQQLVRDKGQIKVPEGVSSSLAQDLLAEFHPDKQDGKSIDAALVFHDDNGLDSSEKDEVKTAIETLENNKNSLGLSNIIAYYNYPDIEDQLVSKDGTTILVPLEANIENRSTQQTRQDIYQSLEGVKVDHLVTGRTFIDQDVILNSEEGLHKTEYITVGIILLILFVVFRSFVAPFIPLLTVGISYLAAQGIVAILADTVNFPLSTFTQIFMVAVMFGIGTDYCILLISRFKEELGATGSTKEAVVATYKSAGKTVLFAGIAVLIGFSTIGLSTFGLYRSAVAVAVGVAVVLIALPTLVPFFMVVLGKKLFWPFTGNIEHKQSKIWAFAGNFSWKRPLVSLLIVAAISLPTILMYDGHRSYNSLNELGPDYDSVKAFDWISDSFGPGQSLPATVVLKTDKKIDSPADYQDIENISKAISELDGVEQVRSATRPAGEVIDQFKLSNQADQLKDGIGDSVNGINQIQFGLTEAVNKINDSKPQLKDAQNGAQSLMSGTKDLKTGVVQLQDALKQIQDGIQSGSQGADQIAENLQGVQTSAKQLATSGQQLLDSYKQMANGLTEISKQYQGVAQNIDQLIPALQGSLQNLQQVEKNNPSLQTSREFQTAKGQIQGVIDGLTKMKQGLDTLNSKLAEVSGGMTQANQGLEQVVSGQSQLADGIGKLAQGVSQLGTGLNQASAGQSQVINKLPGMESGLDKIYGGQSELKNAFADLQDQLSQFADGLDQGADGLNQISTGLTEAQDYIGKLANNDNGNQVYIPKEALDNKDFQDAVDSYLSDNRNIAKFDVVLSYNPYDKKALDEIGNIEEAVKKALPGTVFENAEMGIGGVSSTYHDLQTISDEDYHRTVFLMLIGIFIMLMILLRSIIMPLYLIGSLIITYYTAMGISELIFVHGLGYSGLSWAVPFFAFVLLVALGIDYSIFLMDRFNEHRDMSIKEGLLTAMKNMGTVIISAAIILGGTFAAMLPSGVLSLLEIATIVLAGLFLYAFVMMPLFVPVMVKLFGKANWWPFHSKK